MASSGRRADRDFKVLRRQQNLSPQIAHRKFFEDESSGVEGQSDSSNSEALTDMRQSMFSIENRAKRSEKPCHTRRLFKRKSRMFVKGVSNTLRTEGDYLDSEVQLQTDSKAGEDANDEVSQSEMDTHQLSGLAALSLYRTASEEKKQLGDTALQPRNSSQVEIPLNVFRKNSPLINIWNLVILVSILLDLIVIPLEISLLDVEYISSLGFSLINLIQIIYILDIVVNLHKTYYDKHVSEVINLTEIRLRYFQSSDFLVDILACAPLLAFRKIFFYRKGYNQLLLLIRITKSLKLKQIVVEFHQQFYVNSKLYFLSYLVSVLVIVAVVHAAAPGDLYLVLGDHEEVHELQVTATGRHVDRWRESHSGR
jgi:hypothetical protein